MSKFVPFLMGDTAPKEIIIFKPTEYKNTTEHYRAGGVDGFVTRINGDITGITLSPQYVNLTNEYEFGMLLIKMGGDLLAGKTPTETPKIIDHRK